MTTLRLDATHGLTNGDRRVGLLAGWGRYPVVVAEGLARRGYETFCLGIRGHADAEALRAACADFSWVGLARLGRVVRYFHAHGVRQVMLAGKIHKTRLFERWAWLRHLPDWRTFRALYAHFIARTKDRQDDTLLAAVVNDLESDGLKFVPATEYLPELLVRFGQLSRRSPTPAEQRDIEYGWRAARELGRLDIGQCVAVKGGTALAVEAIEGTDRCIARAGELCGEAGITVVKVAKPQQDSRFDVPTVGVETINAMIEAGARCLAIEAGHTILLDQPEVIRRADRHGIAVVALERACSTLISEPTRASA